MPPSRCRCLAIASLLPLAWSAAAQAADFGERASRRTVVVEEVVPVIVVPYCEERADAVLLGCLPRQGVAGPDLIEVQRILSTVQRPRRTPYPQLLDRP